MEEIIKRKDLSRLLNDPILEKVEILFKEPNIFEVIRAGFFEIRHSNFLAWLLDPNAGHGLGDIFLKHFLRDVFSKNVIDGLSEFDVDSLNYSNIEIVREYKNIDILIKHEKFILCIENKTGSKEHSNQLSRYKEIIEKDFSSILSKGYIFLTIDGDIPEKQEDKDIWIPYDYFHLITHLSSLYGIHTSSLSEKTKNYIEDYIKFIGRNFMKNDDINKMAQQLYENHKDVFDFIIENKPDVLIDAAKYFEDKIAQSGWILGSKNKGYSRFLTKELDSVIPRNSSIGWRGNEAFLFEFIFWPTKIKFKATIAPGDAKTREILVSAMKELKSRDASGKKWLVYFSKSWDFDVTNKDFDELKEELDKIWPDVEHQVSNIEKAILNYRKDLISLKK